MLWVAPSEKDTNHAALEKRLWDAADQFRANSGLKAQEYSGPILGLIFLRFAEVRYAAQRAKLEKASASSRRGNRVEDPTAYHAEGILFLPTEARFDFLLRQPEGVDIGAKVNAAMREIEKTNPPFNVNAVDKERLKDSTGPGRRFPFGLPRTDNANYLWIQLFYSSLNPKGRAGFVMANSASDARSSEQDIRRQLIESRAVDVIVAVGPNMFYTVTLPCTLWFFDKSKSCSPRREEGSSSRGKPAPPHVGVHNRADKVLFIDARHIYRQIDRAHREWTPAQIGFLANLVRLYRGEDLDVTSGGLEALAKIHEIFGEAPPATTSVPRSELRDPRSPSSAPRSELRVPRSHSSVPRSEFRAPSYKDVPGLCKAATLAEIETQGWSLNPGRYVGVAPGEAVTDEDFKTQLETLNEELETLNAQARELESTIAANVAEILDS